MVKAAFQIPGLKLRLAILLALFVEASFAVASASPDAVLAMLGVSDTSGLMKGAIVSYEVDESTDKTLAAGLAMYVEMPPDRLIGLIEHSAVLESDPEVIAWGSIPPGADTEALSAFEFTESEVDEAQALYDIEPGSEFNLSLREIDGFRALARTIDHDDTAAVIRGVSRRYREDLLQREESYRHAGLSGIAPYLRHDGQTVDAGTELRVFTEQSKVLKRHYPEMRTALLKFPDAVPPGMASEFLWVNRRVENRPAVILIHRLIERRTGGAIVAVRDFYVGHSYNSSQLTLGIMPYRNGSLVFYSHCTSTDQVAGIGKSLKHAIGREQFRKTMIGRMERLRTAAR